MDRADAMTLERQLGGALEPVIGQVYFSVEAHANYQRLGFSASPGDTGGVALPDGPAYFTSRGSVMGQVSGEVVASAFAVFNPDIIVPSVQFGWTLTDAATICAARTDGALATLERILGADAPGRARVQELLEQATTNLSLAGRPLAAGVSGLADIDHPYGTIFRLGDLLREYRGDSHTIAWAQAGFDATEIGLLTELYWGLPLRSYTRSRGWTDDHFDVAEERLRSRGLLTPEGAFTAEGRAAREAIEQNTDRQMASVMAALGDDAGSLLDILRPWGAQIRVQQGYLSSGPHDIAGANS